MKDSPEQILSDVPQPDTVLLDSLQQPAPQPKAQKSLENGLWNWKVNDAYGV